ncbi:hypothetical protein C0Q70_12909 [Pomacea canaliculata]|uniref:Nicastrin n=1 Tax=Pomacea canaliculata TaxID=400727 RepID=A0A2T7P2T2_POMCA|nr:hypothetical protein C0Q70_12909 [Pomacea canaliculata]
MASRSLGYQLLLGLVISASYPVLGTRTKEKIYIDLVTQNACFRILNGTHQIGCSTPQGGNVGVVHYMQTEEDWDWVINSGTHTPYAAVLDSVNFTTENVRKLSQSNRVNGIIVISINLTDQEPFSADKSCPNDASGMYDGCNKLQWNPPGKGLMFDDFGLAMFSLTDENDYQKLIDKCYIPFNKPQDGKPRSYPLCAIQLISAMRGAKDSETCIRRSNLVTNLNPSKYCDPMGDENIITTLKAVQNNETRPNDSVIVVATRLDTMGIFHNEYPGADSPVTGLVTLLATAKALWSQRKFILNQPNSTDIMFAFFQGEAFDYIGSSRMVYDMQKDIFPSSATTAIQKINLTHIHQFIELNQVGLRSDNNSLWLHVDEKVINETKSLIQMLKDVSTPNATLTEADPSGKQQLPPASLQQFLLKRPDIPSVVITDHQHEYTNRYYNSRLDLPNHIDYRNDNFTDEYNASTALSQRISALATTLARYLFTAATGKNPTNEQLDELEADITEVNHMLYCFLISPQCELFNTVVSPTDAASLTINQVTQLTRAILAYYTGEKVEGVDQESQCGATDGDKV